MKTAATVIGALVIFAALIGFVRALWRRAPRSGGNEGYGTLPGETPNPNDFGGTHGSH